MSPRRKAEPFFERLEEYRASLRGNWSPVKKDLCSNLRILNARFAKDFSWMREDGGVWDYDRIREIVNDAYNSEMGVIGCALQICDQIDWAWRNRSDSGRQEIMDVVSRYESESRQIVGEIDRLAAELGIHLLSVTEYEEALHTQGSANPEIMVFGEIMNETYNINNQGGVINLKSTLHNVVQTINNGTCLPKQEQEELAKLVAQLQSELQPIAEAQPRAVKRITTSLEQITNEITADEPDHDWLKTSLDTFNGALTAVKNVAPTVLDIGAKIAAIVSLVLS